MKVFIAGGGPAGLYAAYAIKRLRPAADITVVEQNPADATFGFGVVFSDRALDFLREDDSETYALLQPAMEMWSDLTVVHRGERIRIDGVGFAAIARLELLQLLQRRLASVGVTPRYRTAIRASGCSTERTENTVPNPADYDLIIAADGVNSITRDAHRAAFGTTITPLANRFVWYGTTKPFDTLTQTFLSATVGTLNAHHYRYQPGMSTFIVECDPATFERAGFAGMSEDETRVACERLFTDALDGHKLITNKSLWRPFPKVWNERWHVGNTVLVGDALRTAHFSIGSGTRLALEDVVALVKALDRTGFDVTAALPAYQAARRPVVEKLVMAANASAAWYDDFATHMRLAPWDFAWSYMQRSGRIDIDKLAKIAPRFVAGYRASRTGGEI